jgi:hypothetical protein
MQIHVTRHAISRARERENITQPVIRAKSAVKQYLEKNVFSDFDQEILVPDGFLNWVLVKDAEDEYTITTALKRNLRKQRG